MIKKAKNSPKIRYLGIDILRGLAVFVGLRLILLKMGHNLNQLRRLLTFLSYNSYSIYFIHIIVIYLLTVVFKLKLSWLNFFLVTFASSLALQKTWNLLFFNPPKFFKKLNSRSGKRNI